MPIQVLENDPREVTQRNYSRAPDVTLGLVLTHLSALAILQYASFL
jgi:hypothetical protein